jgi:hypothetical protein
MGKIHLWPLWQARIGGSTLAGSFIWVKKHELETDRWRSRGWDYETFRMAGAHKEKRAAAGATRLVIINA